MSVFLSHAGEQKKVIVDYLYHALKEENIPVFMDEHSLVPGTAGWDSVIAELCNAAVGVNALCCTLL